MSIAIFDIEADPIPSTQIYCIAVKVDDQPKGYPMTTFEFIGIAILITVFVSAIYDYFSALKDFG